MHKLFLIHSSLCFISTVVGDNMIGPGKWNLLSMEKKEGLNDKFVFDIRQRKYNRTHDIFQGSMTFHEELNESYGAKVDVCKYVDGGCKQFQVLTDNSFESMVCNYADENFKQMLRLAGCEDPKFPVPEGEYKIKDYLWDWTSMPDECPYGKYLAENCVMMGTEKVGCIAIEIEFKEDDGDEE